MSEGRSFVGSSRPVAGGPLVRTEIPGPRSKELSARLADVECPAFDARRDARGKASGEDQGPVVLAGGEGDLAFDVDGNRFVDLTGGFGALVLGHTPKRVTDAFSAAYARFPLALGDVFGSEEKLLLCEALAALYPEPGARVMLGLSGADAVTSALKTAVLATGRSGVVAFEGAYHGLSYGPLAACGLAPGFREPFADQLARDVTFAPYPSAPEDLARSLEAVRAALSSGTVGAVLVEPLLGRGGCVAPPKGFLHELATLTRAAGALLVADEIWTGLGRSGTWMASLDECVPDLVCLGKALGAGVPISACVGRREAFEAWGKHGGTAIHTATHFGAPPACAAALATLTELRERDLPARATELGRRFREELTGSGFLVSGRGAMVGISLDSSGHALAVGRRLLREGYLVLTGGVRGDKLTLSPPLVLDFKHVQGFSDALRRASSKAS